MVNAAAKPTETSPMELYLAIRRRIDEGSYPAGAWLPTERALAEEFRVHRASVRRAFVRLEEEGKISRQRGARPWVNVTGSSRIGAERAAEWPHAPTIVAMMPQHPIYPASQAILHGINMGLRARKSNSVLRVIDTYGASPDLAIQHEMEALRCLGPGDVVAVIIWQSGDEASVPLLRQIQDNGKAIILVDRIPDGFSCDYVGSDNMAGVDEAVGYLVSLGHRRIGFVTTDEVNTATIQRKAAYQYALSARSLPAREEWIFTAPNRDFSAAGGAIDQFDASPEPPTAVIALCDPVAYFLIAELETRGRQVPQDMSVVGFDDLDRYSARPSILTTIRQPFEAIGKRAAELALMRLDEAGRQPQTFQHVLLSTPLIARSTCRPI